MKRLMFAQIMFVIVVAIAAIGGASWTSLTATAIKDW